MSEPGTRGSDFPELVTTTELVAGRGMTDGGDVYARACGGPDRTHRTQGSPPASVRPPATITVRTLDLD